MGKYTFFWVMLCSPGVAFSIDIGNPGASPLGHYESMLGNAGAALKKSPGNSYFNPAGMDASENQNSITATQNLKVSLYDFTTTNVTTSSSSASVSLVPSFVYSTGFGRWAAGVSIYSPQRSTIESEISESISGVTKTTLVTDQKEDLLFGASAKYGFSDRFSLGVTLFLERYTDNHFISVKQTDGTAVSDFIVTSRDNRSVHLAYSVIGLLAEWSSTFATGLRLQTPGLQIQGDTDHFNSAEGTNKSQSVDTEFSGIFTGNLKIPIDVVLGNALYLGRHTLLLDLGLQLPVDFESIEDSRTGSLSETERIVTKTTLRIHAGYRFQWNSRFAILVGAQYNPSTIVNEVSDLEFGAELDKDTQKITQATFGVAFRKGKFELVLGGFYSRGELSLFDTSEFGTETQRDSVVQSGGGHLSTSFRF